MDDRSLWMIVAAFPSRLRVLSGLLDKAAAYAEAEGVAFPELSQARLAPDMLPLNVQVQLACRLAVEAVMLPSGRERPSNDPLGESLDELKTRIDETLGQLEAMSESDFQGAAARRLVLPLQGDFVAEFSGAEFLRDWSLPNFYFHLVTAYDILRHKGVSLGKADFVAHIAPAVRQQPSL